MYIYLLLNHLHLQLCKLKKKKKSLKFLDLEVIHFANLQLLKYLGKLEALEVKPHWGCTVTPLSCESESASQGKGHQLLMLTSQVWITAIVHLHLRCSVHFWSTESPALSCLTSCLPDRKIQTTKPKENLIINFSPWAQNTG